VEREVPQTEEGSSDATSHNVVRLGDWIGPHDELVPFGRRAPDAQSERPPDAAAPATFIAPDPPPSADDFWGERSGGLHDALQAPAENREPVGADSGTVCPTAASGRTARSGARLLSRWRPIRRRFIVAGVAMIAFAATGAALTLGNSGGSAGTKAATATTQVASVLTSGMHRILSLDLPVTTPRSANARVAEARHSARVRRSTSRPRYVPEPVHYVPPPAATVTTAAHSSSEAGTAQAGAASPPPTTTSESVSRPPSTANAYSAPVPATGQSGALGPVQSPNG